MKRLEVKIHMTSGHTVTFRTDKFSCSRLSGNKDSRELRYGNHDKVALSVDLDHVVAVEVRKIPLLLFILGG